MMDASHHTFSVLIDNTNSHDCVDDRLSEPRLDDSTCSARHECDGIVFGSIGAVVCARIAEIPSIEARGRRSVCVFYLLFAWKQHVFTSSLSFVAAVDTNRFFLLRSLILKCPYANVSAVFVDELRANTVRVWSSLATNPTSRE